MSKKESKKTKIINVFLIILMVTSISIFVVTEVRNRGKIDDSISKNQTISPEEIDEMQGDNEKELKALFDYYNSGLKKETFEKFFVKNKGEYVRCKKDTIAAGIISKDNNGNEVHEFPVRSFYPLFKVENVDIYNQFNGEDIEDGKICVRLEVIITNDSQEDAIYSLPYLPIGIVNENYTYEEQSREEEHYREFKNKEDYIFYKNYYDENNNSIGMFPSEENLEEIPDGVKFLLKANSSKTYYEYYVIPQSWIETGRLVYGDDGLTRERMNGTVDYCTSSFRIFLFPENKSK